MSKRAVLLLNLGSPKTCEIADVREYLREFLGDPRVLDIPAPLRWLLLNAIILRKRPPFSAAAYRRIWTPDGSPLVATTKRVRLALTTELLKSNDIIVADAMRYGEPSTAGAIAALASHGVTDALVLPQYPHYAMSSYGTAVECARATFARLAPQITVTYAPPFYNDPRYTAALVASALPWLQRLIAGEFDKLLFSFHGIPLRHLRREIPNYPDCDDARDCCPAGTTDAGTAGTAASIRASDYRHQCFATLENFAAAASTALNQNIRDRLTLSFQSRLGAGVWLKPYTDATLRALPAQGVKRLLVICPAFTVDCLETLDEINNEGRHTFLESGGTAFEQIPCLNDHPAYIQFLAAQVSDWTTGKTITGDVSK